jgi:hypothetical protein
MLNLKKRSNKKFLIALGCMLVSGIADARIPRPYWESIEYFDANGIWIGWVQRSCYGPERIIGTTIGAVDIIRESGPCS